MNSGNEVWKNLDKPILIIYLILVIMGWFNIYSAVYDPENGMFFSLSTRYGKQLMFIGFAFILALMVMILDLRLFLQFAYLYYGIAILLLIAVLVVGTEISGAKAWIQIGPISLQPAEFAKFATCLAFAKYTSRPDLNMSQVSSQLMASAWFVFPVILIMLQPDAGSALVYASFILVLYREGMSVNVLIMGFVAILLFVLSLVINQYVLIGILAVLIFILLFFNKKTFKNIFLSIALFLTCSVFVFGVDYAFHQMSDHQRTRINVLLGKDLDLKGAGYNVNQSKIAIGSGGLLGKGFLEGTQTKFNFVPEQSTDFIFCTIGEEWGWIGSTILLSLFLVLLLRLIKLAERQRSDYARIYGYGVACILFC
ncbi:MAG: rod shape-determining protein RodA, partial [Bacteroidales bacterium]